MKRLVYMLTALLGLGCFFCGFSSANSPEEPVIRTSSTDGWKIVEREFRPKFPLMHGSPMVFSPDMRHVVYPFYPSLPKLTIPNAMILDGVKQKQYDSVENFIFSPDSKRFAYAAKLNGEEFVVLDGVEGPHYNSTILCITFSPDSKHFVYTVNEPDGGLIVFDGKAKKHLGGLISDIVFSPDSQHWAYAINEGGKVESNVVYLDGNKFLQADEVFLFGLKFSPDSRKLAISYRNGKEQYVAFGVETFGPYENVEYLSIQISPDGERIAIPVTIGGKWFLICGSEKYGPYETLSRAMFSPDSKSLINWAEQKKAGLPPSVSVFFNGEHLVTANLMSDIQFSPDGKQYAFSYMKGWAKEGQSGLRHFLYVDGSSMDLGGYVSWYHYSSDSKRFAYTVRGTDGFRVIEDDKKGKPYHRIGSLAFSPDSKHLAYQAFDGQKTIIVIDGQETFSFQGELERGIIFTEDNHLCGAAFFISPEIQASLRKQPESIEAVSNFLQNLRLVLFDISPDTGN